jgi:hypothetical protein
VDNQGLLGAVITANCAILVFILFAPEIHALPAALQSCPCAYRRLSDRQAPTRSPTHHDFLALLSRNLVKNRCSLATPLYLVLSGGHALCGVVLFTEGWLIRHLFQMKSFGRATKKMSRQNVRMEP